VKAILQRDFSDGPSVAPYPGSNLNALCPGGGTAGDYSADTYLSSYYGVTYNPVTDAPNEGAGFSKDLSGNELPNTPHFTLSFGAQYTIPVSDSWAATLRGDAYWQANSWARVYNDKPYDMLHGWSNFNVTFDIARSDGLQIEAYVKNLFNTTAITDAFLNSDDSALTTNVFTTDPRLIGFSITKRF
jgi:outer membrane receptor protein involved in Fe transport